MKPWFGFFEQEPDSKPEDDKTSETWVRVKRTLIAFALWTAFGSQAFAEGSLPGLHTEWVGNLTSSSSSSPVKVGDELKVRVEKGTLEPKPEAISPESGDLLDLGWELSGHVTPDSNNPDSFLFEVVPTHAGPLVLPSLVLKDFSGVPIARTGELYLEVQSAIAKDDPKRNSPNEIEPEISLTEPAWVRRAKEFGAVVLVLSLLVAIGIVLKRWMKSRKDKPAIPLTSDEKAYADLKSLESRGLAESGNYKEFHFKLSEIMKTYIGERYQFDALGSTSREICDRLQFKNFATPSDREDLVFLFDYLDLIKFTDYQTSSKSSREALEKARIFVTHTRLKLQPVVSAHLVQEQK